MEETEKEKSYRINNIVFCQLLPVADNMISFEVNKRIIKNVISGFAKQYNLPEDLNNHLTRIVEDNINNHTEKSEINNKQNSNICKVDDYEIIEK
jgi:hypothetical protein